MKHTLTLHKEDGYIEVKLVGIINETDTVTIGKSIVENVVQLGDEGKRVRILADFTDEVGADTVALQLATCIPSTIDKARVAMFGANERVSQEAEQLLTAGNKDGEYKLFKTREEAITWLLS